MTKTTADNGYISVVNKALEKVSTANPYSEGYGALYDIDGNGVEERILVFTTTKKMSGGYDFPVKVCSLYTMSNGAVVCLIDEEELFAEAGDPSGHASVIRINAREYEKFHTETLCDIHRTMFGGLYEWAGAFRAIPIMKAEEVLVLCTQGIYSIYDYLERIYFDAAGLLDDQPVQTAAKQKDYSVIEGYKVADYKEQPHTYMEE